MSERNVRLSNNMSRENLIMALNEAMNDRELPDAQNMSSSNYDASTGTMYCTEDGTMYEKKLLEESIVYFEQVYGYYKSNSATSNNAKKAQFCKIALEAIKCYANIKLGQNTP